jgi:hypothetical protein
VTNSIIMKFTTFTSDKEYDLAFRKWNYAEALIKLRSKLKEDYVCLDTDTKTSLTNKDFVLKRLSKAHIHLMTTFLIVRDIESNVHEIKKYVNFSIYLSRKNDSTRLIEIHRKLHLMKELKVNMLIENDILRSKEITINVQQKTAIIRNCENLIIKVKIHQREFFVRRNIISQFVSVILSEVYVKISYKMKNLFSDRDFLFESYSEVSVFIYAHVIDARIIDVIVRNESAKSMKISKNFKLDVAQEIQYDDCFYVSQKHHLTLQKLKKNSMKEVLKAKFTISLFNHLTKNTAFIIEKSRYRSSESTKIRVWTDSQQDKKTDKISFDITVSRTTRRDRNSIVRSMNF